MMLLLVVVGLSNGCSKPFGFDLQVMILSGKYGCKARVIYCDADWVFLGVGGLVMGG